MPLRQPVLVYPLAPLAGAVVGVLGSFVHGMTWYGLPLGLITSLTVSLAVFVLAGVATRSRAGAGSAVLGWLLPVLLLAVRRDEGDLVISGTPLGYAWSVGGMILGGAAMSWPYGSSWQHPLQRPAGTTEDDADRR